MHELDTKFGRKAYDVNEKCAYAQLMYETDLWRDFVATIAAYINGLQCAGIY